MSNKLLTDLESLTPEEMQKVANLIGKFAGRKNRPPDEKIGGTLNNKKSHKPKPKKNQEEHLIIEHSKGSKTPRRRVILEEDEPLPKRGKMGRARSNRRDDDDIPRNGKKRRRGVAARSESVNITGENRFLKMRERNQAKNDSAFDKAVWSEREVSERPEKYEDIEVRCLGCKEYFLVNPALVLTDTRGNSKFRCNDCARDGAGSRDDYYDEDDDNDNEETEEDED